MNKLGFESKMTRRMLYSFVGMALIASLLSAGPHASAQGVQICGYVWNDVNCDGASINGNIPDADDIRFAGAIVTLYDSSHHFVAQQTSVTSSLASTGWDCRLEPTM